MNIITTLVIAKNLLQQVVRDRLLYILGFYAVILALAKQVIFQFAATTQDKIFLDAGLGIMNIIGLIVAVFIGTSMINQEIEIRTILTGVYAVGRIGNVDVTGSAVIDLTGFAVPVLLGNVSLVTDNNIDVTGFAIPTLLNSVDVQVDSFIDVTGVYAVGRIGNVTASGSATVLVTGVKAVVKLKVVNVWGLVDDNQTPNWADITPSQSPNWTNVLVPSGFD